MANYENKNQVMENCAGMVAPEETETLIKNLYAVRKFMKKLFHQGVINCNAENEFDIAATCTTIDKTISAIQRYNTMLAGKQDLPDVKEA